MIKLPIFIPVVIFCFLTLSLHSDESQSLNETIAKVVQLKEKNNYDDMIKLINDEIKKGQLYQIYFEILGGAYDAKKNKEDAYLSYLKGSLYNPTTEYARTKLIKNMNYYENRIDELEKGSWLARYLIAKKAFDDGDIVNAEKKISELSGDGKHLDVLCVINKDIKSLKDIPKETKSIMGTFSEAESMFLKVISQFGDNCPEYVYYEYADLLFKTSKYSLALENYQISVRKNPSRRDNKLKVGACQLYSKNYSEAKQTFLQIIEKRPEYAEAFLYLGFSHWALKEPDKAIKAFTTVVEMNKTNNSQLKDKAKKAIVVVNKGDLFLTPGDMDKIIKSTQSDTAQKQDKPDSKANNKKGQEENDQPTDKK